MVSATSQGSVRINAPSISGNSSLSLGNVPITEVAHATYSVRNNGSAPLVLERATFLAEGYSIVEELPITIANSKSTTITVAYQPTAEGDFSTTMNLYTNDPNNRLKTVALSGHVFEPNVLSLTGQSNQDGTYTLSVAMDNYTDIVAVQYDLHWRSDMTTSQSAFIPSARMQNHNAVVTPLDEDSYRIIIYSMSNATIARHDGELHQLVFTPQQEVNYIGSVISIDNIVLSNQTGVDKSSQEFAELVVEKDDVENDIPNVQVDNQTSVLKFLYEGHIYIRHDGKIYTIMGQEM
jgi:hemin uptake protein HemP